MTYYEELGISADASAEEIRQAHRRLVKLLHPDQHQDDEELRRLADLQLMRVNALVAELLDPASRDSYDARLRAGAQTIPTPATPPPVVNAIYRWAACVISGLALVALLSVRSPTDVVRSAPGIAGLGEAPAGKAAPQKNGARASRSATTRGSRIADPGQQTDLAPVIQQPPVAVEAPPQREATAAAQTAPVTRSNDDAKANPDSPKQPPSSLSGTWLYAGGSPTERDKDLYRPEYIELRIREDSGHLRGDYRSRYAVTDLAIPPSVNFTFEGKAAGESWRWQGTGGATGTLTIRLLHRNAIQVDWRVTDFGANGAGLEFGTATLVRRL